MNDTVDQVEPVYEMNQPEEKTETVKAVLNKDPWTHGGDPWKHAKNSESISDEFRREMRELGAREVRGL